MGARLYRHGLLGAKKIPAPQLWLRGDGANFQDSARTTAASADGDLVGSLTDNVSTNHFTASGTNRPTLKTGANGKNGLNVVRFDGSTDYMLGNLPSAPAAQTLIMVVKKNTVPDGGDRILWEWNDPAAEILTNSLNDATKWFFRSVAAGSPFFPGTANSWNIIVVRFNSNASMDMWAGGGAGANFDPSNTYDDTVAVSLGGPKSGASNKADVDFAEARWFSSALTLAEINATKDELASKWAITTPDFT